MRSPLFKAKSWWNETNLNRREEEAKSRITISDVADDYGDIKMYLTVDKIPVDEVTSENFDQIIEKVKALRKTFVSLKQVVPEPVR